MAAKRSPKKKSSTNKKAPAKRAAARKPAASPRTSAANTSAAKKAPAKKPGAKKPASRRASAASSAADERLQQLERLVEMMVDKDVVEVELEESGARWRVRRNEPQAVTFAAPAAMPMPAVPGGMPAGLSAGPASGAAGGAADATSEPQGEVFTSPMLGTYYQAPSPDAEAFVKNGDRVGPDTTICIIEAMKVMNEIKAERDFEIVEILVKNGEPVEFGQPMFIIR
ncbi:MAG: acetyl-CoA carboxylase biotin carboxyl carrier protein [Planctomycetota bacterium]